MNELKGTQKAPLSEIIRDGEKQEVVTKRILYRYEPLYTVAAVICIINLVWATAFTIDAISNNMTARACFQTGGSWQIDEQGNSECLREER